MKKFAFINAKSEKEFKALPEEVKEQFATDLQAVREGKNPFSAIKHLTESVGTGAIELIENGSPAYRTVYAAKFENTVFVLHSFTKTTNGVDKKAMNTAKGRYKLMIQEIRELKKQAKKSPKKKKKKGKR